MNRNITGRREQIGARFDIAMSKNGNQESRYPRIQGETPTIMSVIAFRPRRTSVTAGSSDGEQGIQSGL